MEGIFCVNALQQSVNFPPHESLQDRGHCTFWFLDTWHFFVLLTSRVEKEAGEGTMGFSCCNISDEFTDWFSNLILRRNETKFRSRINLYIAINISILFVFGLWLKFVSFSKYIRCRVLAGCQHHVWFLKQPVFFFFFRHISPFSFDLVCFTVMVRNFMRCFDGHFLCSH